MGAQRWTALVGDRSAEAEADKKTEEEGREEEGGEEAPRAAWRGAVEWAPCRAPPRTQDAGNELEPPLLLLDAGRR